jgi:uncharacterized protein
MNPTVITVTAEQVLHQIFDHFLHRQIEDLLALVDTDCHWVFPGSPILLPWAGEFRGHGILQFFDLLFSSIDYLEYTPHRFHSQGDIVTILSHEKCYVRSTGKVFTNDLVVVARVKQGKLVEFLEYSDTAAMQAAFLA